MEGQMHLSGQLSDWSINDLLQIMQVTNKTGSLDIEGERRGRVHFREGRVTGADNEGRATAVGTRGMPSISGSGRGPPNPAGGGWAAAPAASKTVVVAAAKIRANGRDGMVFPQKRGTPYVTVEETRRLARFGSYWCLATA